MATGNPGILESLLALKNIPSEAQSAGAGLAAKQAAVTQLLPPQAPLVPTHVALAPQDAAYAQGPYGSRPGEQRLDGNGDPIVTGFVGVQRAPAAKGK